MPAAAATQPAAADGSGTDTDDDGELIRKVLRESAAAWHCGGVLSAAVGASPPRKLSRSYRVLADCRKLHIGCWPTVNKKGQNHPAMPAGPRCPCKRDGAAAQGDGGGAQEAPCRHRRRSLPRRQRHHHEGRQLLKRSEGPYQGDGCQQQAMQGKIKAPLCWMNVRIGS